MGKHSFKSSEADGLDPTTDSLHRLLAEDEARELIRRTRQYDERALTRIYNLFADRVFRFIYYRVQDRPHAEDLTNEVFVRLLESVSDFRASGDDAALLLTGWIFTIARNIVIDFYRRQRTHSADSLSDTAEEIPDTFDSDFHLTRADLQLALAKLTEEQQTVLLLRFEEGFTSAQIAKIMGKTDMAVKALQRRALASMARLLDEDKVSPETLRKQWSRNT